MEQIRRELNNNWFVNFYSMYKNWKLDAKKNKVEPQSHFEEAIV